MRYVGCEVRLSGPESPEVIVLGSGLLDWLDEDEQSSEQQLVLGAFFLLLFDSTRQLSATCNSSCRPATAD